MIPPIGFFESCRFFAAVVSPFPPEIRSKNISIHTAKHVGKKFGKNPSAKKKGGKHTIEEEEKRKSRRK